MTGNDHTAIVAPVSDGLQAPRDDDGGIILERILPYLTNRLAHHMNLRLAQDLRPYGLSISNWRVLAVLAVNEKATVNELSAYAMVVQPTMSRLIDRMVAEGLLDRRYGENDGRVRTISLTPLGWEKYRSVQETVLSHTRTILSGLDENDRTEFFRLLQKMTDNILQP